jgi:hypothetical protein
VGTLGTLSISPTVEQTPYGVFSHRVDADSADSIAAHSAHLLIWLICSDSATNFFR